MNHILQELANTRQTYRKMLSLYWITIILTVILEGLIRLHQGLEPSSIWLPLIAHAAVLATVTGVVEWLSRYRSIQRDWLLITTGILFASSIVWMNPTIGIVPAIYIFPILTSVLSFNKKPIIFSFATVLLAFAALYGISEPLRMTMQPVHTIGILFLFTGTTVIALAITSSGIELLDNLKSETEAKQELLVKNIIMDTVSKIDALTELYNHKTFHEYLEKLIEQSERNSLPLQLAILDIDSFKRINDTYGHWVGDIVLMRVAAIMKESVTPNDFVARYGGEEFAIIFTEKTLEEAHAIVENIRQKLYITFHPELENKAATISIGLQDYVKGEGKEGLFKGADASLYIAKRSGKNRTVMQAGLEESNHSEHQSAAAVISS
ncbi:GGDEF domain-containing protein [Paenibacillus sp. YYML68]|uniref:GGDEF domain-containing protein n=1 Tax=Paenibacillus sp. YYML68 TaxID=2909250 RepID=UPI002491E7AD|nr:GGDEF domain-containing protein [Paenibacillus sp. YYML68]